MVYNQLVSCNSCKTKIRLRAQIGYCDIPFNIHCPKCFFQISGHLLIDQENVTIKLDLLNAALEPGSSKHDFCAELSAEFPTRKIYENNVVYPELSPFMRSSQLFGKMDLATNAIGKAMVFPNFVKNDWRRVHSYFEPLWNERAETLYKQIEDEIINLKCTPLSKVNNILDATMALHQLLLMTSGIIYILPENTIQEYMGIRRMIDSGGNPIEFLRFIDTMKLDLNSIERGAIKLIDLFSKLSEQLIPVIALRDADCMANIDKEEYGIMTANFDELSDFYAKSSEWILDNINIVIASNNIIERGDFEKCIGGKDFKEILFIRSKYNKLNYISEDEFFSRPTSSLNNRIRNAIQHFDNKIDYNLQRITFTDNYAGKSKTEEIYLIDFTELCIENFSMIMYLMEIVYNFKKLQFTSQGIKPSS